MVESGIKDQSKLNDGFSGVYEERSHIPVLLEEVLLWLNCRPGGVYVDCTLGAGGMTTHLLHRTGPTGSVIAIDCDAEAVDVAKRRLAPHHSQLVLVHGNFQHLTQHLHPTQASSIQGVIFDLGISSVQLENPERGFSFRREGPLDMRMNRQEGSSAEELLATRSEGELASMIFQYGEERYARRIARRIVATRTMTPIRSTGDLASVIRLAVPASSRHQRIHCATRTFQAIRIVVNQELEVIGPALCDAARVLSPGGRVGVISFHSLEDRITKQTFKALSQGSNPLLRVLTKKPVVPSEAERRRNPRARSAKLRVAERLGEERAS